ncbi:MAG: CotH kinase family protein [Lachnospiraceae bacterium]|nr:CotH kinase family protein [Lachnospiraceae bacterium]
MKKNNLIKNNNFKLKRLTNLLLLMVILTVPCFFANAQAQAQTRTPQEITDEEFEEFAKLCNPTYMQFYGELYQNNELLTKGTDITYTLKDEETPQEGLFVTGKNSNVKNNEIIIKKKFSCGQVSTSGGSDGIYLNLARIDAVAEKGKRVFVNIYLNDETEPLISKQLPTQDEEGNWDVHKPTFIDISSRKLNGGHYFTIMIEDQTTKDKKESTTLLRSIKFYEERVPLLNINIDENLGTIEAMNKSVDHSAMCYGSIDFDIPTTVTAGDDMRDENTHFELEYIRGRGNSTWNTTKKPYKIKLAEKADLFGMGKNKHWVLLANYYDATLIKNSMTYYLGDAMGLEYTPKLQPVDLVMNGEYLGTYFLAEQIRIGKSRIEINDLEETESDDANITGGYLLSLAPYKKSTDYKFKTDRHMKMSIASPNEISSDKVSEGTIDKMRTYIQDYVQDTEDALFGEDFKNSEGVSYTEFLDIESAAKYFLIQSFSLNVDAYNTPSTYMYKKEDGKLYWGPIWDFDYVAWNYKKFDGKLEYGTFGNNNTWMNRLCQDKAFRDEVARIWGGLDSADPTSMCYQLNLLTQYDETDTISSNYGFIQSAFWNLYCTAEANYDIPTSSAYILGSEEAVDSFNTGEIRYVDSHFLSYKAELNQLITWIKLRMEWYDANLEKLQESMPAETFYKLNFYNDDELVASPYVTEGGYLEEFPEPPTKEGYVFDGWSGTFKYKDENGELQTKEGEFDISDCVYEETNLYATWIPEDEYTRTKEIAALTDTIYAPVNSPIVIPFELLDLDAADNRVFITSDSDEIVITPFGNIYTETNEEITANITVTTADGLSKTFKVITVNTPTLAEGIETADTNITLEAGNYKVLNFTIYPSDAITKRLKVLNIDPDVAYITPAGVVHAVSSGTTTLYVAYDGVDDFIPINVTVVGDGDTPTESASPTTTDSPSTLTPEPSGNIPTPAESGIPAPSGTNTTVVVAATASAATNTATTKSSVTVVRKGATFNEGNLCYKVTQEGLPSGDIVTGGTVSVVGYLTINGKSITKVNIPETVTILNNTFTVTKVNKNTFKNCKFLKNVTLGKNIKKVDKQAFAGCKKLSKVTFKSSKCKFGKKAFKGIKKNAKFYVPKKNLKAYKKALKKVGIKAKNVKGK